MGELVKELFDYIQFMVLGVIGIGLVAYLLATFHPLRAWLVDYVSGIANFWLRGLGDPLLSRIIHGAVAICILYYLGVAVITTSYWFVEPLRVATLNCLYSTSGNPCDAHGHRGEIDFEIPLTRALTIPILGHFEDFPTKNNVIYFESEARVDMKGGADMDKVLSDEVTFARLLRGTAFLAFIAAAVATFKLIIVIVGSPIWIRYRFWYENLIDEDEHFLSSWRKNKLDSRQPISAIRWLIALRHVIAPQVIILIISLSLYATSIISYRGIEFEYSTLVRDGADLLSKSEPVDPGGVVVTAH